MNEIRRDNEIFRFKYWNTATERGMVGIYIVAVTNLLDDLIVLDWAAYIGASVEGAIRMKDGVEWAARNGEKLSRDQAAFWFPSLPIEQWRA